MLDCFGLERTLKIISFQLPCHGQGCHSQYHIATSTMQPGLEHFQGWRILDLFGKPCPLLRHPLSKGSQCQFQPALSSIKPTAPCPVTIFLYKMFLSILFISSLQPLKGALNSTPSSLFSRLSTPSCLSLSS